MTAPRVRNALIIGVSAFGERGRQVAGEDSGLPDLSFVPGLVQELAMVLERLGYACTVPNTDGLSTADLRPTILRHLASSGPDAVQLIHVLSHGREARGEATVYALGSDGLSHPNGDIAHWLTSVENLPNAPTTLFLLDLCSAGSLARLGWQADLGDGDPRRAWVLAASQRGQQAYEGRFTQAVIGVLRALANSELDIDPTLNIVPLEVVARAVRREVQQVVQTSDGYPQQVTGSLVDISSEVDTTPFFTNPAHRPDRVEQALRTRLDPGLAPFLDDLDEGLDARHFVERGAGLNALTGPVGFSGLVGCFTGRAEQLKRLAPWLNGQEGGRLMVVTGSPGVGKSALLGVLVCAGHATLREHTRPVWQRVAQAPYRVEAPFAAVHARQRDLAAILASLKRQLELDETATAADLTHALCGLAEAPVVVLDALDEADDSVLVMNELLLPLAAARRADGGPAVRLLVGTRSYDEYLPLLRVASAEQCLVDLDDVPRHVLEDDLERYVHELLGVTRYRDYGAVRGAFAAKVARILADPGTEPTAGRWGEFLVAGLYTRYLVVSHRDVLSVVDAERLGGQAPRTLPDVLELDLSARSTEGVSLRPTLAALAHSQGQGMPASVLARVASAFVESSAGTLTHPQLRQALEAGRFYLRQNMDSDGTTLYRLFHQGLADHLRQHAHSVRRETGQGDRGVLLDRLLGPLGPPEARDWDAAEPYLLRHALQHAADANRAGELLADPGFLLAADPVPTSAVHGCADSNQLRQVAAVQEVTRRLTTASGRWTALALNAVRAGLPELAARAANPPPSQAPLTWQPRWAVGRLSPGQRAIERSGGHVSYGSLGRAVRAVACTTVNGIPVAVTGGWGGAIRLWDLRKGEPMWAASIGHTGTVGAVACTTVDGIPYAITGSHQHQLGGPPGVGYTEGGVYMCNLRAAAMGRTNEVFTPLTENIDGVRAVACTTIGSATTAVAVTDRHIWLWDLRPGKRTGSKIRLQRAWFSSPTRACCGMLGDRSVAVVAIGPALYLWDLEERRRIGAPILHRHAGGIHAMACTTLDGTLVAVTGGEDGVVRVWDMLGRRQLDAPLTGYPGDVRSFACTTVDGALVAVIGGADGTIRMWDLRERSVVVPLTHPDSVAAVACTTVNGTPVAVTGGIDGLRIWPLGSGRRRAVAPENAESYTQAVAPPASWADPEQFSIQQIALATNAGRHVVLLADADGGLAARDIATGEPLHAPTFGSDAPLASIRPGTLAGRQVAVVVGADGHSWVWDMATGRMVDAGSRLAGTGAWRRPALVADVLTDDMRVVTITGQNDGVLRLSEAATGASLGELSGHHGPVTALSAVELDGRRLAFSGGTDGTVRVWDIVTLRQLDKIEMLGDVSAIVVTPDGYLLVVAAGEAVAFRHIDHIPAETHP